ncbi:hypothetical protein SVAN01_11194 [Stagonosporopsis vannaccii]|nr:hypothetical protein SVAN01_11194 [Stagonosporopsis vannaccii]
MRLWLSWPSPETRKLALLRFLGVDASHLNTTRITDLGLLCVRSCKNPISTVSSASAVHKRLATLFFCGS